tara:strand:- start:2491 stop:2859 length:369 start_codon:yes stop_codon:yes gene_type:complete
MERDELKKAITKLKSSNHPIVVEGKKDKIALSAVGIPAKRIIPLNKRPLYQVVEDLMKDNIKHINLLPDLDPRGKKIFGTLNSTCSSFGIKVNTDFRNFLYRNTKLRQIEGIATYLQNLEMK